MRINKWIALLLVSSLLGCAQEAVKKVETAPPEAVKPVKQLTDSDKRDYKKALEAIANKRFDQAEAILVKLTAKYPDAGGPLANLGIIYVNRNKPKQAEDYFLKALERNDKLVQARNHLAVLFRKQGRFTDARHMLEQAIVSDPYYALAYYNLGILYELYLQEPEKALENYQLYLDLMKQGDKQVEQWVSLLQRQIKAGK